MPPRWSKMAKRQINTALAECAPECYLSDDAIKRLESLTGFSASQLHKSAENFRRKIPRCSRVDYLKTECLVEADDDADDEEDRFRQLSHEETRKVGRSRYSDAVLGHLVNAAKHLMRNGQFDAATLDMISRTTRLSEDSIRRWIARFRAREGRIRFLRRARYIGASDT
jgi:thermostable 8-oxoguanine DNA glycosylase